MPGLFITVDIAVYFDGVYAHINVDCNYYSSFEDLECARACASYGKIAIAEVYEYWSRNSEGNEMELGLGNLFHKIDSIESILL